MPLKQRNQRKLILEKENYVFKPAIPRLKDWSPLPSGSYEGFGHIYI